MNRPSEYQLIIKALRYMDEKQLAELMHDVDDVEVVQRIFNTSEEHLDKMIREFHRECMTCKSDEQDAKELDDAQRYEDIKSTQEG